MFIRCLNAANLYDAALPPPPPPPCRRNRTGIEYVNSFYVIYGKGVMSAQMLEVSLLGVGTVLRFERDAWSTAECIRQATNEYAPPPHYTSGLALVGNDAVKHANYGVS